MRRRGNLIHRRLSVKEFGSMDTALQAAIEFRDQINRECVPLTKRELCATIRGTNTSGVPGVFRARDGVQEYWKAGLLTANGTKRTRQFSIKKYGEDVAFDLAIQARSQLLDMVSGFHVHHPDIKNETRALPATQCQVTRQPCRLAPDENPYARERECDVPGVGITNVKTTTANGTTYITRYWTSMVRDKAGLPKRRYFSVAKHGEDEAKRLAVEHQLRAARTTDNRGATPEATVGAVVA